MKKLITASKIRQAKTEGIKEIVASKDNSIITPEAKDLAKKFGIKISEKVNSSMPAVKESKSLSTPVNIDENLVRQVTLEVIKKLPANQRDPVKIKEIVMAVLKNEKYSKAPVIRQGSERKVDSSGIILIKGQSVKLERFEEAGPDKNIRLADVVTHEDGSPIAAGIMEWKKESFPWTLTYDEVDIVLEGILSITIDGKTFEGHAGDMFYIPKGSSIIFGTPTRTKVFYSTYPANWAQLAKG
ncbi:MAG: ethanolamine utilization acetate kinase EutQ [Calditrichaceae bacterium]